MRQEKDRDLNRVAEILLEALAMAEGIGEERVLVYLITMSLLEADPDFRKREYFSRAPRQRRDDDFRLSA